MAFLQNMRIGVRLQAGFAVVLLLLLGLALAAQWAVSRIQNEVRVMYQERTLPVVQMAEIDTLMRINRQLVMEMMINPASAAQGMESMKANRDRITVLWKAYTSHDLPAQIQPVADAFAQARGLYVKEGLFPAAQAILDGDLDGATQIYDSKVSVHGNEAGKLLLQLEEMQTEAAAHQYNTAQTIGSTTSWLLGATTVVALLVGGVLAVGITRSIVRPVERAVEVANTVAAGDLSSRIEVVGRDEAAQLLQALKTMNGNLARIVTEVRHGSEAIAQGSAQIAMGNEDLSQRTETQASNLQQTAASMEQLTATVKQNAATAQQASQLSRSASESAARGGQVVGDVVHTMEEISSSSHKIADIISVIDGIAFQTNILALNAAVEAARAGEQGRGFAVVASEVRSLAGRSAQAAKEIKDLIGASVERVENGAALVSHAGQTMTEIVEQVQRVSTLINEITSAGQEQSTGIGQVGEAVAQLDQMTQQNAALVEESAAAAGSLRTQAERLAATVRVFKLSGAADAMSYAGTQALTLPG